MLTLVLQVELDRIIYFTDDPNYVPPPSEYTWVAYTDEPLPEGLTLKNCFSYRFREGKFDNGSERDGRTPQEVALESNKRVLIKELGKKFDALAEEHLPSSTLSGEMRRVKYEEALENGGPHLEQIALAEEKPLSEVVADVLAAKLISRDILINLEVRRTRFAYLIRKATKISELEEIRRQINAQV